MRLPAVGCQRLHALRQMIRDATWFAARAIIRSGVIAGKIVRTDGREDAEADREENGFSDHAETQLGDGNRVVSGLVSVVSALAV